MTSLMKRISAGACISPSGAEKKSIAVIFAFDDISYSVGTISKFVLLRFTCVSRLLDCPSEWRELVPFSVSRLQSSIQFATDTKFVQVSLLISYLKNSIALRSILNLLSGVEQSFHFRFR